MSKMDNKPDQQSCTPSHSSATNIQRPLYISLTILSLIFISISATHFLVNDKTLQTIIQVIAYILGTAIGITLFLTAHNQRKTNHPNGLKIMIFLYIAFPAFLLGIAYFSKIIGDAGAILGSVITVALVFYEKSGKSKEIDIQENTSTPSPAFIQENSPTSIQNNSPISINNNNNSPISIQNNITTNQNVTNNIDKKSERERATAKACEMLASKDSTSRIFGVKMLVKLADSWLDDSDPTCKKDEEKSQDIIDILCAYIRLPFPLAQKSIILSAKEPPDDYTGDFFTEQATFREEQNIRRTIFTEMSKRSSSATPKVDEGKASLTPTTWSKFDFNFSRASIFYPLENLTLENPNFSEAKFYNAKFSNLFFNGNTRFDSAVFEGKSDFTYISFNGNINLDNSEFTGETTFKHINFSQNLSCIGGTFHGGLKIKDSSIIGDAHFNDSTFEFLEVLDTTFRKKADFTASESQTTHFDRTIFYNEAIFKKMTFGLSLLQLVTFQNSANFQDVTFTDIASFSSTKFKNNTNFMNAEFCKSANFNYITFTGPAYFVNSTFNDAANFSGATFKDESLFSEINFYGDANFEDSTFEGNTSFNKSLFDKKADFTSSNFRGKSEFIKTTYNQGVSFMNSQFAASPPLFSGYIYNNTKEDWFNYESIFSELVDPKNYIFDISPESQQKLETKKIRFNEKIFVLPVGGDLYDPECPPLWDDEDIY